MQSVLEKAFVSQTTKTFEYMLSSLHYDHYYTIGLSDPKGLSSLDDSMINYYCQQRQIPLDLEVSLRE